MKRLTAFLLAFLLPALALAGCGQSDTPANIGADKKISVVCTVFPVYDWVRQILGNRTAETDLSYLLKSKIDFHNYQPTVNDIVKISTCDLFIYIGGESDKWVEGALSEATNRDMVVLNLLDMLGSASLAEEIIEGMEEEQSADSVGPGDEDREVEADLDEHVWLSLRNAQTFCLAISDALSALEGDYAGEFGDNAASYISGLKALDAEYQAMANAAPVNTLLFGDRFPFRYLVDNYGLEYFAAFPGCSAETEASFETIIFLSNKVDELGLDTVMVTESADQTIARTIINNTAVKDQQILVLDSMQSVTSDDVQEGTTYLSLMGSNLNVLKEALGKVGS
jgi:zinc transport system substrate-binding protein